MLEGAIEATKQFLRNRSAAYRRTFLGHGTDTDDVLADLGKFCRANETTFHADPRIAAMLEGRREVWLRIQHHLQLSTDELWSLYANKKLPPKE